MNFEEYLSYDALGLAELVRTNQISESELLEITIELCNRIDPKINAVFNSVFGSMIDRFPEPTNSDNGVLV